MEGEEGNFKATVRQYPRYVDRSKCTSCGECAKVCPIEVKDQYNLGLNNRKATYKLYPQAIPGAYAIEKRGTAPCKATCPAHVSIQGYIALINQGRYREALELFKEEHPFPGICGRVCHHPCEGVCSRNEVDEALAIRYLHRFLADEDRGSLERYIPEVGEEREEKVAVIGSGPGGLSCAYFLRRRGYRVTVFERLPVAGGMMAVGIPAYRLPREILEDEIEVIRKMGVEIRTNVTFGKDITLDSLKADGYKAVFLAIGLHRSRALNVPNEGLEQVLKGVDFLRDAALNREVSLGREVVVIGGGNVAIDVALTALRKGAGHVKLVCLEQRHEMPAWEYEIEEALEEGVEIINGWGPKRFLEEDGRLVGIEFKRCTSVFDEQKRFNPQYDESELMTIRCDSSIVAIGQAADLTGLSEQGIPITARGGIEGDPVTLQTSLGWVFAGGDVFYGPRSVVEAVESGKEAAESIHRYLNNLDLKEGRKKDWSYVKPDTREEVKKKRVDMRKLSLEERRGNFQEIALGYTEEEARKEAERCLKCGICSECYQCVKACLAGAINHGDSSIERTLTVGSIILALGGDTYDPTPMEDTHLYKVHPNVVTSIEFERILSASGPTMGHLVRPSDGKEPRKIAWIQCIGSRDINRSENGYCSYMCCMYAIKEAVIAKEHSKEHLDTAIFFMDMRAFGKDYEKYYRRAEEEYGVRFIRSRVHSIEAIKGTDDLLLRYVTEQGRLMEETFDMVVLSVGIKSSKAVSDLCKNLGIDQEFDGFVSTPTFMPVKTSRPGIYVCGIVQSPKDIPSSVADGSAAACAAAGVTRDARWSNTKTRPLVEELDVSKEEPRIGVFVCKCGINIAGVVDVPEVAEYASRLPHVKVAEYNLFTCSQDTQERIKEIIKEHRLNRVVVASCSPRTHEPLFMETLEACGLNKYLFEMANIRDQCSWVHGAMPQEATLKAKDLVRMAVARAALLKPLKEHKVDVIKRGLVIGGGVAGMNAALGLAEQGFETLLIERDKELGGFARHLTKTIQGDDIQGYINQLSSQVLNHPRIEVRLNTMVVSTLGVQGNYTTEIEDTRTKERSVVRHGTIILATGAHEYRPKEFMYGEDPRVMTQVMFSRLLEGKNIEDIGRVVMIQCVGSRNQENPNCSRVCCQSAIKNAIHIKELYPNAEVIILYRDIRTYGRLEYYYEKARKLGVLFSRFDPETPPEVTVKDKKLWVTSVDAILNRPVTYSPDYLVLSAGIVANETEELSKILKVARNADGYFLEAHAKLRPVDMASDGVFLCGTAHSPMLISEAVNQAMAASARAATLLAKDYITMPGVVAEVTPDFCASCLVCVRSCPYGVPKMGPEGKSEISPALCHGCGVCVAECPAKAITLKWYEDDQIITKVRALFSQ